MLLSGGLGGTEEDDPIVVSSTLADSDSGHDKHMHASGVRSMYNWRNELIDACIVRLLKYALRSRTGEFRNSAGKDFAAVPFDMLSDFVRSELSEQYLVTDEDIIRRSERLVSLGVIEKVPGAADSLRSVAYSYLSEYACSGGEPTDTFTDLKDASQLPETMARATGNDLFNHLKIVLGIARLPSTTPGIPRSMFKARFLSWTSLADIPESSKSVLQRLLDNASRAEDSSPMSSQATLPPCSASLADGSEPPPSLRCTPFCLKGAALGGPHASNISQSMLQRTLGQSFECLFRHISEYLKRCGRHHDLHAVLGLDQAYFEHMPTDLASVVVRCYCGLTNLPQIDIKAFPRSSAPASPSSHGDRTHDRLDFSHDGEGGNADEDSPFGENSHSHSVLAQNPSLNALWHEGPETPRLVSFADVVEFCPSTVANTLLKRTLPPDRHVRERRLS